MTDSIGRCPGLWRAAALVAAGLLVGCGLPPTEPPPQKPASPFGETLRPYVPASQPADPVGDVLPTAPRDAQPAVPLRYTVELWAILLPRGGVSANEAFWKRVEEQPDPETQMLQRNGIRVGTLPVADIETVRKLIEDRGGTHTTYNGVSGRQVEIPVSTDVPEQIIFYFDQAGALAGRSWERCDNLFFFSFETTPRNSGQIHIALTPAVRAKAKKTVYAIVPGKPDRELSTTVEQSQYDATVAADLPLERLMVIAPSVEARQPHTLGGTFLMEAAPNQMQERVILVIPHAYTRDEGEPAK